MKEKKISRLHGTLDLPVLETLALGPLHGLGVSQRIEQITKGTFAVEAGSLFPALHRMEEAGWPTSAWGESENRRRAKSDHLTPAGQRRFGAEAQAWQRIGPALVRALHAT